MPGRIVTIKVDKITFDEEDEVTKDFNPATCGFYIYKNMNL